MSEVFDFDALVAEARKEPFRFRYAGREWELPHASDMDWRAVSAAEMGNYEALRHLFQLGFGDQWEAFEQLPQPAHAMTKLFQAWQRHAGVKPGESQGSGDSSTSTAEPSTHPSGVTAEPHSGGRSPES